MTHKVLDMNAGQKTGYAQDKRHISSLPGVKAQTLCKTSIYDNQWTYRV